MTTGNPNAPEITPQITLTDRFFGLLDGVANVYADRKSSTQAEREARANRNNPADRPGDYGWDARVSQEQIAAQKAQTEKIFMYGGLALAALAVAAFAVRK